MNKSSAIEKIKSIVIDNSIRDLVIRLNILSIPLVGSHLDAIYTHFENRFKEKHLIEKINGNHERQVELLTHAWQSVLRCDKLVKAERILDILSDTFEKRNLSETTAEDVINLVVELSENEAIVFREIYDKLGSQNLDTKDYPETNLPFGEGGVASHHNIKIIDIQKILPQYSNNLAYYVNRLIGKGLLREADITTMGSGKIYWHTLMGYQLFNTFKKSELSQENQNEI